MIWRVLHAAVFAHWLVLLVSMLCGLIERGDLPRTSGGADHFEASVVVYMLVALTATAASALRSCWLERDA